MNTQVVNIRAYPNGLPPNHVYIGRAGRGFDGYFGNPFHLNKTESRGATIERFRAYAIERAKRDPEYRARIAGLKGKTLVCFCKPEPCHGDVLAELAEEFVRASELGHPLDGYAYDGCHCPHCESVRLSY